MLVWRGLAVICLEEFSADKNLICRNDLDLIPQTFSLLKWAWSFAFEWTSKKKKKKDFGDEGINLVNHKK